MSNYNWYMLHYAYPSSTHAKNAGFYDVGCYYYARPDRQAGEQDSPDFSQLATLVRHAKARGVEVYRFMPVDGKAGRERIA